MSPQPCNCSAAEVQAMICEILDSGTTSHRAAEIRDELGQCPECLDRLNSERELRLIMRRCCQSDAAPGYLRERISTQIRFTTLE